jgi:hypothetical protein
MSNNALYELVNRGNPVQRTLVSVATLDFPSISAASTQTLTVTVPGAAVGDVVAIGLPATVNAGIVFDARVSAADTLTVRAMNITASPVDPASATYDFVVFKI